MARFLTPTRLFSALYTVLACTLRVHSNVFHIPTTAQNGTSVAQFTSTTSGLDAPKVQPINGSAFDWWYFDVVSTDPSNLASVVVIFFTSGQTGFPFLPPADTIIQASLEVSFPNGTILPRIVVPGEEGALITTKGDSTSGDWLGTGFSFTGNGSTNLEYEVHIDAPDVGVKGTLTFSAVGFTPMNIWMLT
ncbi:hypothetical protein FB45DRAFT_749690 [Roridomyces roridus]|uniref:Diels-Alderase N-terminal domain-containing protein n=1 Tax=Roridomyces roridus TaxID=1738132 RepID=A0AAD7FLW1_9AGAR|nr:hypothetical protein FB45DRAFT_749690 [Roridomyces roridus]